MGPLPKRKLSKGRRDRRRARDALGAPSWWNVHNAIRRCCPTVYVHIVAIIEDDKSSTLATRQRLHK